MVMTLAEHSLIFPKAFLRIPSEQQLAGVLRRDGRVDSLGALIRELAE
jgi:hypothetical protein